MYILDLDWSKYEGRREVKTASGDTKTGLSMQKPIPRDYQPCDHNGTDKKDKKGKKDKY